MSKVSPKNLEADILAALRTIQDPEQGTDIVALGMVSGLQISEAGEVVFSIEVDPKKGPTLEPLRQAAEQAVSSVQGVTKTTVVLTAEKPEAPDIPDPHGMSKNPVLNLPIKHIIAVASGKGGVGKSTVAANLALSLAKNGQNIGLLDADVYGPSQPRMMGVSGQKPDGTQGQIEPIEVHGIKLMSMGFMVEEEKALVWRGPMVQSAIYQMLRDVNWGTEQDLLDILVVDMPPGTGDAQLTMAQKVPLSGAVIVSTPQDIALLDARKGVQMFEAVNIPILGLIENMSVYECSNCGHEEHIFGHGGAEKEAKTMGVPFLGALPLHADIRLKSDEGTPIVAAKEDGSHARTFDQISKTLISSLEQKRKAA